MVRPIVKLVVWTGLIGAGATWVYVNYLHSSAERQMELLQQQNLALQEENRQMQKAIERLTTQRRIARIRVVDQRVVDRQLQTTLKYVEYRKDGSELTPREFKIEGDEVHLDAQIVKFRDEYVEKGDPLRGQSIILMLRVYGAFQAPANGFPIDSPGDIPEIYRGADVGASRFEQNIWDHFWQLFNDKNAREAQGIRSLHGEGLWGKFQPGHVYTIDLRPDGGMIREEPEDPLYQQRGG